MKLADRGWIPATEVGRLRLVVGAVAVLVTVLKLTIAANTFGTNDVTYWLSFAEGAREHGPVDMYGHAFAAQYNHPPLAGWFLMVVNELVDHHVAGFPFLIRMPASIADLVTALLVFELVRSRRPVRVAAAAGVLFAVSPLQVIVSGFHGNTDPVFVMLTLLSLYLLVVRHWAFAAGAAFLAAVSVKLVPVVVGPVLLAVVIRQGWRRTAAFGAGAAVVFLPLWGPVLWTRWPEFAANVLGYPGVHVRQWGILQFLDWLGAPVAWTELLIGPGRFVTLAVCALVPALLAWWRPDRSLPLAGLTLVLFLLLSSAFGMQYLTWPLAAAYLVGVGVATIYNLCVGLFAVIVYSHWNNAYPWDWDVARAVGFEPAQFVLMTITWLALAAVAVAGVMSVRSAADSARFDAEPAGPPPPPMSRTPSREEVSLSGE